MLAAANVAEMTGEGVAFWEIGHGVTTIVMLPVVHKVIEYVAINGLHVTDAVAPCVPEPTFLQFIFSLKNPSQPVPVLHHIPMPVAPGSDGLSVHVSKPKAEAYVRVNVLPTKQFPEGQLPCVNAVIVAVSVVGSGFGQH
jgi:hypothetical protein